MNINCLICTDLFSPAGETYVTSCGHMFHHACLMEWIKRSETCPQCRFTVTERTIHRVFFNLQSNEGDLVDIGALQDQVDKLNFQMELKEKDAKIYSEKCKTVESQNKVLWKEVRGLEEKASATLSEINELKQQIEFYQKNQLNNIYNMQPDQLNEMLQMTSDPVTLKFMATTFYKALKEMSTQKRQLSTRIAQLQYESHINDTRLEARAHLKCEIEQNELNSKIVELQLKLSENSSIPNTPDTSKTTIMDECPAPIKLTLDTATRKTDIDYLTVKDQVKAIKGSKSPYLRVKHTYMADLMNFKYTKRFTSQMKPVLSYFSPITFYYKQKKNNRPKSSVYKPTKKFVTGAE